MSSASVLLRRLKFWVRLSQAYIKKYRLRLLLSILGCAFIFALIFAIWSKVFKNNVISIGYVGSYSIANIPSEILTLATQPLISTDKDGRPTPSLASHWTVSEDGKTYIVFLKDNLKWHDDTLVDTGNISIAITNIEITALNNKVIEFKLPGSIASFPQALNKPVFKANTFYGTGEYKIVKIDEIQGTVKKITLSPKKPNLPIVEIKFYQTQQQAANALKIGEIKSARIPNGSDFGNWQNIELTQETDYTQNVTLFFNNDDPNLSSKELRQALAFSINRSEFDGEAAHSPISPQSWAYNENVKTYSYNTGKSKELLSKLQVENISLNIKFTSDLEKIAQSIKKDWEELGIKTTVESTQNTTGDFQVLLAVNELMPDPDQYSLWHSTQTKTNITKYKDARIDKLLEDARSTNDEEKRKELYLDFQKSLVEDAPAVFLYHPHKYNVVYKNIKPLLEKLPSL